MYEPFWDLRCAAVDRGGASPALARTHAPPLLLSPLPSPLLVLTSQPPNSCYCLNAPSSSSCLTPPPPPPPQPPPTHPPTCSLPLARESKGGSFAWLGLKGATPASIQDCLTAFTADERMEVGAAAAAHQRRQHALPGAPAAPPGCRAALCNARCGAVALWPRDGVSPSATHSPHSLPTTHSHSNPCTTLAPHAPIHPPTLCPPS
jgi:hypothetical protein